VALLHQAGYPLALSFAPVAVLGTALAIFLAFRANTAFARWQEGAQLWANINNASRIFARLIITFTDSHQHTPVYNHESATQFKQEMVYRHLAWVNALRLHLRRQPLGTELAPFLSQPSDHELVRTAVNVPNQLLHKQGEAIYGAMATGVLQGFDSFQLEGQLAALSAAQANAERLKTIPIPRQYDYFTRLFVRLFVLVLPLFLVNTAVADGSVWLILPLTLLIAFLFTTIERIAAVNEDPFENRITDVPLTALCRDIERDLRAMLGETNLPDPIPPQDGYLW
jgi:ion channel-forming bestrophin family protein